MLGAQLAFRVVLAIGLQALDPFNPSPSPFPSKVVAHPGPCHQLEQDLHPYQQQPRQRDLRVLRQRELLRLPCLQQLQPQLQQQATQVEQLLVQQLVHHCSLLEHQQERLLAQDLNYYFLLLRPFRVVKCVFVTYKFKL